MKITQDMLDKAQSNYDLALKELSSLKAQYAKQECPFKVGDVVEVCGYTYSGKMMRVDGIKAPKYKSSGNWKAYGTVLKKDGSDSVNYANFDQSHYMHHLKSKG